MGITALTPFGLETRLHARPLLGHELPGRCSGSRMAELVQVLLPGTWQTRGGDPGAGPEQSSMASGWNEENYELCGALCFKPEGRKTIAHGVSRREQMPAAVAPYRGVRSCRIPSPVCSCMSSSPPKTVRLTFGGPLSHRPRKVRPAAHTVRALSEGPA